MAEGKLDPPEDLGPTATRPPAVEPWESKGSAAGGNEIDKVLTGVLEEVKDQATPENIIPLSPQWLYAKPTETKMGLSAALGDTRAPNPLPQGTLAGSAQKDARRLDLSQDKKEWRRNVPDLESARRWREEERETGLLSRRERRKEGDRENEFRKSDRRSDSISMREPADSRTSSASDRRHDVAGRSSVQEGRRDTKWSSRWGPEDKEKDSKTEKKVDTDKEDPHVDKQSVLAVNRPLAESDARDKWRPRHRQEGHSVGSTVYHAAPGFGTEKGRVDGSNAGFALGRGRANITRDLPYSGPSSSGPIGSLPSPLVMNASLYGMSSLSANTFRYPRGKLLDIYGKCKIDSAFDTIERIEEGSPITQSNIIAPLAFVKPDPAEEVALVDISKNKVVSTDASYDSSSGRSTTVNDFKIEQLPGDGDCKTEDDALSSGLDLGGMTSAVVKDGSSCVIPCSPTLSEKKIGKTNMGGDNDGCGQTLDSQKDAIYEAINSSDSLDVTYKLPDDSNSLFDTSFIKVPGTNIQHQNSSTETKPADQGIPADLSLFYLDPQGEIQGPFLAEDIISWYDEGFFGTDLPVCLSGASDGMVFQPLGKVIPDLSSRPQPNPSINHVDQSESSSTSIMNLQADASTPVAHDDRQIPSGDGSFNPQIQHKITDHGISVGSHYGQEAEEVLYTGRSLSSSMHSPTGKFANDLHNLSQASSSRRTPINETGHPNSSYHKVPTDYNVNPLGLTWSELEGTHQKGPLSSNIPGVGDQGRIINSLGGDGSLFRHKQEQFDLRDDSVHDAWPSNFGRNNSSNVIQDALDARQLEHFVPDSNQLNLENMLSQHFQEQQFQQQHLVSPHQNIHLTGSFMEQLQGPGHHQQMMNNRVPAEEHSLKLQFQQQRHLQQLEEQRHLQQLEEQRLLHQQQQQFHQQQLEEQLLLHQQLQQLHQQQQQQQQLEEQRLLLQQQQQLQQQQELHNQMQLVQQQQQQQLLMEQLLHRQLHDPSSRVSHVDPLHGENTLEEVLYKRHLLELQQQAQHAARNLDPSIDQLIQAKIGPNLHHDHHNEMLDALAHHSHNTKLPLEHQFLLSLQQEQQQQAYQFPISLRQHLSMEKERHADGLWSVDESGQFVRAAAMPHQSNSSMLGQLDFAQHSQRPSSFDHREGNFILHDQMQRNSQPFERPVGTHEPNMNFLNTLAQLQGMDVQERHSQMMNPGGHMTQLPSGSRSRQNWIPDHFPAACSDKLERSWTEPRGQLQNSLIESQFSHLHQLAEQQKREMLPNHIMEDQSLWTGKSERSNQLDLLDQKLVLESLQSSRPVDAPTQSYENREPSWLFPRSTKGSSYNLAADKMGSEGRQDPGGKLAVKASEIPSGRKETRVRRTSSYSETESTEASFTDMVKGTKKPMQDTDASSAESLDVAPVGRSGKKKVKKGKQIDPSLLGFKVHSKRMLMGEIHRPDD